MSEPKPELPEWISRRPYGEWTINFEKSGAMRMSREEIARIAEAHRILTERGE